MKTIPLTKNKVVLIDDSDYSWLTQWKWYVKEKKTESGNTYYAAREENGETILMHRIIMNTPDNLEVDHKDRNGLNCQRYNMRNCTNQQNGCNRKAWGSSKYLGVSVVERKGGIKYRAIIQVNRRAKHLGYFSNEILAAQVYDEAAKQYHGEFANLNFK